MPSCETRRRGQTSAREAERSERKGTYSSAVVLVGGDGEATLAVLGANVTVASVAGCEREEALVEERGVGEERRRTESALVLATAEEDAVGGLSASLLSEERVRVSDVNDFRGRAVHERTHVLATVTVLGRDANTVDQSKVGLATNVTLVRHLRAESDSVLGNILGPNVPATNLVVETATDLLVGVEVESTLPQFGFGETFFGENVVHFTLHELGSFRLLVVLDGTLGDGEGGTTVKTR